jgi:hypothetical protein
MNLIATIQQSLSNEVLGKIGSQIGQGQEKTRTDLAAVVPAVLAAFGGMSAREDGLRQLSGALGGFNAGSLGDPAKALAGTAENWTASGGQLLQKLFGRDTLSGLVSALGPATGLNAEQITKLIALVLPLLAGSVGSAWKSRGSDPSALAGLLMEQRAAFAGALPAGFSLDAIPGLEPPRVPTPGGGRSGILMLILVLAIAAAVYYFYSNPQQFQKLKDMVVPPTIPEKKGDNQPKNGVGGELDGGVEERNRAPDRRRKAIVVDEAKNETKSDGATKDQEGSAPKAAGDGKPGDEKAGDGSATKSEPGKSAAAPKPADPGKGGEAPKSDALKERQPGR